jgi:hypothetical protein
MGKKVTLQIQGSGGDTDAPTVRDFLDQLQDFFGILSGVEEAISSDAKSVIEWRIVSASMNSPIRIEAEAFSREYGVNIDRRVNSVVRNAAEGLRQLSVSEHRPPHFTDSVLQRAESFFLRVTNGLANAVVDYGDDEPTLEVKPDLARSAGKIINKILKPTPKAYRELGSVEGYFRAAEIDGHHRPLIWIKHRLTGSEVKCVISSEDMKLRMASAHIGDVWKRRRLLLTGIVYYKALGKIDYVEAEDFRLLRQRHELPSVDDILDETFTNGMKTEDYLEKLRNGEIH